MDDKDIRVADIVVDLCDNSECGGAVGVGTGAAGAQV